MTEREYITETGERVRERAGLVEVGLSPEAQAALGELLHFQPPDIGTWVNEGDHLFVFEGTLSSAQFYAPVSGRVVSFSATHEHVSKWLVEISVLVHDSIV